MGLKWLLSMVWVIFKKNIFDCCWKRFLSQKIFKKIILSLEFFTFTKIHRFWHVSSNCEILVPYINVLSLRIIYSLLWTKRALTLCKKINKVPRLKNELNSLAHHLPLFFIIFKLFPGKLCSYSYKVEK